jgi:hypothetical protein
MISGSTDLKSLITSAYIEGIDQNSDQSNLPYSVVIKLYNKSNHLGLL